MTARRPLSIVILGLDPRIQLFSYLGNDKKKDDAQYIGTKKKEVLSHLL